MKRLLGGGVPIDETLRAALGTPRVVRRLASSPRSRVWLVEFDGAPAIVKHITGDVDAARARFAREVTALGLAARANPPVAPRVLGTDPHASVMVLEYLDSQPPTEEWVIGYASALARLHTTTTADDRHLLPPHRGPDEKDVSAFLALARHLNVPVPTGTAAQLEELCARLAEGGHALLHGDPCPGNDLHTPEGVRFVDLEQAAFGDGMTELAYLRIGFPTCWCVTDTPPELRRQAELAYREQWRADTGAEPTGDLVAACAGWLLQGDALVERAHRESTDQLARATRRDWSWGTTTARGRLLHRTAVVAALADGTSESADFGHLCRSLHESMRKHWPEAAQQSLPTTRTHVS